ncbi:MAG: gliding motility lipoprotein GldH [Sphingobacteriales bacterium 17-39-43]|uniref:gliding motility lipoprotein GldH n=1 Tax=Daejeonella sp. TaxID=2805397 RepID=UPI000BD94F67|nr:gliding motility lipoprotein GldH [Daejeonella sp.]OYZ32176.1 MAG: gliding motility lipoprotein GldH [Sphingobacteriales bacterium 16-39-50]OZA25520.1 MAG: gliding motility lipoprotein GldH [Sphingobacteriales bacterium 17-39-43]OZA59178.1 MAG: gliding motility lipoprotein GldH [Sphingobacteriales bacterium 39-40-5]HQS51819.1 gliding motility lipoprotein GldH [Daejeonella sp.]HQT22213.1 gliding motility lipoprotein GldH [Daejeonella sp.]
MKTGKISFLFVVLMTTILASCQDQSAIVDTNIELDKHNWSYTEKVKVPLNIESEDIPCNLYLNLRHTSDYKYSNIFLLIHITGPDGKKSTERREFKLALPDGEWLGSGSGNLYSYQILFKENFKFPLKGKYIIELEQNMRDNPLDHITDAGIRVERVDK